MNTLCSHKEITILPADKGNATVVIDTADYEKKVADLLEHPPFKKLKKDPTARNEDQVYDVAKTLAQERSSISSDRVYYRIHNIRNSKRSQQHPVTICQTGTFLLLEHQ